MWALRAAPTLQVRGASDEIRRAFMNRVVEHIALPAIAPVAVIALYFTPVSLIGCVNRGPLALAVVVISLLAGIAMGLLGLRTRREDPGSRWWWIGSMCILMLPALLVLGPLG